MLGVVGPPSIHHFYLLCIVRRSAPNSRANVNHPWFISNENPPPYAGARLSKFPRANIYGSYVLAVQDVTLRRPTFICFDPYQQTLETIRIACQDDPFLGLLESQLNLGLNTRIRAQRPYHFSVETGFRGDAPNFPQPKQGSIIFNR